MSYIPTQTYVACACVMCVCTDILKMHCCGTLKYMLISATFTYVTETKVQHLHSIWIMRGRASQRQKPAREYKLLLSLQSSNVITFARAVRRYQRPLRLHSLKEDSKGNQSSHHIIIYGFDWKTCNYFLSTREWVQLHELHQARIPGNTEHLILLGWQSQRYYSSK